MTPEHYRQLKGLLIHSRRQWPSIQRRKAFQRGIIPTFPSSRRMKGRRATKPYEPAPAGQCRWCLLPTKRTRAKWHPPCVTAYRNANGQTVAYRWPSRRRPPCACGMPATELDHQDALVLAWTSGDPRRLLRAYDPACLVWLCRQCHQDKTQEDLRKLAAMREQQVCLAGVIQDQDHGPLEHGDQDSQPVLAEGGVLLNIRKGAQGELTGTNQSTRRRVRFTHNLGETTCPRCLTALEFQDRGPRGNLLGLPPGWSPDEQQHPHEK